MSTNDPGNPKWWGRVRQETPPPSTLVGAFGEKIDGAADAIVLQGYSGRSTIVERAREFLDIAERNGEKKADIDKYRANLKDLAEPASENILRIYLTPRLDRYVDFHRSCLIGWRYEAKAERQDAITVWLKASDDTLAPIPYRVVQETRIGPSFSAYLGGDLVDDYLGQPGLQGAAWDNQAGPYAGGKYTTPRCGE